MWGRRYSSVRAYPPVLFGTCVHQPRRELKKKRTLASLIVVRTTTNKGKVRVTFRARHGIDYAGVLLPPATFDTSVALTSIL